MEAGAKGLLAPSVAEVESEQELFKGHVGPCNACLSLRAHHLCFSHPISSSCCHLALRATSSVPVALGSVDPEQQCWGEGGRKKRAPQSLVFSGLFRCCDSLLKAPERCRCCSV